MTENIENIINLWPSISSLAEDIEGVSEHGVYKWRKRRNIPAKYWKSVVASARKHKISGITFKRLAAVSAK